MAMSSAAMDLSTEDLAYSRLLPYVRTDMPSYMIGKHHKLIAHYLQKLEKGEVTRLAIFMPPRHGKTLLASEYFSSWYMGRNPTHEVIFSSYAQDRSDDVGKAVRNLMLAENYAKIFPDAVLRNDAKGTRKFQTKKGGSFFSVGWGGAVTGRGANCSLHGTLVETEQGPIKIENLHASKRPPRILSLNYHGQLCYSSILKSIKIEDEEIYELKTRNGRVLRATADHRVYSRTRGFIRFEDIEVGERLVCSACSASRPDLSTQTTKPQQALDHEVLCSREVSNKSGYSSHKHQQPREFGDSLPFSNTSLATDIVSVAPRLYKNKDTVYDLRVEETHNYFTEEILVHNCLIMDDLIKDRADAQSDTNRRKREDWFSSTAYTRLMADEGSSEGRILLIMTRWAFNDIASYLLNELAHEKWHILNCPAVAEENDILGREPGEALWPEKYPIKRLNNIKQSVQADDWTSLYQQRPLPKDGGLVKLPWFNDYDPHKMRFLGDQLVSGAQIPDELKLFSKIVISLDTAYKPAQINDPSALTVWGYHKNRQYLLEAATKRLEFPQLKIWIQAYHNKYQRWNLGPVPVLIEDAASGQSLIQVLKQQTNIPVIAIYPDKSKLVRMEHVSDYIEAGRVFLPEKAIWLTDFKTQVAQFPYAVHDDLCDSMSQYLKWIYKPKKRKRKQKLFFK